MNRSLWIPASLCVVGFAALTAIFHVAAGRELAAQSEEVSGTANRAQPTAIAYYTAVASSATTSSAPADLAKLLSRAEAEQMLTTLAGEYVRPWQERAASPTRTFSRALVRPIPSILAKVEMPPSASDDRETFAVATIVIQKGDQAERFPCVIGRNSKAVLLFADGKWLPSDKWLAAAPLPN